ncbi:MAG: TAXI family TRAP transporter solute-binding subunit [Haloechinothrix sp.]
MRKHIVKAGVALASAAALAACGSSAGGSGGGMPNQLVWSTYGTGTATYADLAAVADAVTSNVGTRIRIITSDTAVGRLTPVRSGQAHMARTGDEYIFSFEGDYDFATKEWGPQDVRVVWAPVAPHGLLVRDDSGIKSFEDLRGKRFPRITANPSVNNKLEAFLAYGGLTWDDVEPVQLGYSEQPDALKAGKIDVLFQQVYGSSLYELESAFPVRWLSMDDDSAEKVGAVKDIAPSTEIGEFGGAPGQEKGETAKGLIYTVPIMTYADTDETLVYETVKAIHDNYDSYRGTTATTPDWSLDVAQTAPRQVPFHPGLVRFLQENNEWTDEFAARNSELIKRGEALRNGWQEFIQGAQGDNVAPAWTTWKERNLADE